MRAVEDCHRAKQPGRAPRLRDDHVHVRAARHRRDVAGEDRRGRLDRRDVLGELREGFLGAPVPSGVEGPALSGVEGPALSGVEGPALSGVEGPVLSGVEGPLPRVSPFAKIDRGFARGGFGHSRGLTAARAESKPALSA